MVIACSGVKFDRIKYMPLPNSNKADVWLHQNIQEVTDDDGGTYYRADEVYFRAAITLEEVTANFDALFENGGPAVSVSEAEIKEDKIAILEHQIAELSDAVEGVKSDLETVAEAIVESGAIETLSLKG